MQWNAGFSSVRNLLILERETGFEPATSSLGIQTYIGSKSLARFYELNRVAVVGFDRAPWRLARGSGKLDSVIPQ